MQKRLFALGLFLAMTMVLVSCGVSKDEAWKVTGMEDVVNNASGDDDFDLIVSEKTREFFKNKADLFPSNESKYEKYVNNDLSTKDIVEDFENINDDLYTFDLKVYEISTEEISSGHNGTVMYGEDDGFLIFVVMFDNNEEKIIEGDVVTVTGLPYLLLESTVDLDNLEDMSVSDNRIVLNIAANIVKK